MNILITGCSKGFGLLFIEKLAQDGHKVYATYRDRSNADALFELAERHHNIHTVQLDVNEGAQIQAVRELIERVDGRLNVLINNAGYGLMGELTDLSPALWKEQFQTNVFAPAELTCQLIPLLNQAPEGGLVVNISSIASYLGLPAFGAYSASKAALNTLSMSLAIEQSSNNLSVVVVEPGPFRTKFRDSTVQAGEISNYQKVRSKLFGTQEDPETVAHLIGRLVEEKANGKATPLFREIPIGKGSNILRLISRWLPQEWIVSLLAREMKRNF